MEKEQVIKLMFQAVMVIYTIIGIILCVHVLKDNDGEWYEKGGLFLLTSIVVLMALAGIYIIQVS